MKPILVGGHEVVLLQSGGEFFPSLIAAIDAARREIFLETYIFNDDRSGQAVCAALTRAAQRGVVVRLTVDGFGTGMLAPALAEPLRQAGVEITVFRPARRWDLSRSRLRRLHRKLVLIDEELAFVGGINLIDDLVDPNFGTLDEARFDFAVRLRGPLIGQIAATMMHQWLRLNWRDMVGMTSAAQAFRQRLHDTLRRIRAGRGELPRGPVRVAFIVRDNLRNRASIETAYLDAIRGARREIIISNAYFLPGRRFRRALREAAARGVRVRLLLQGRAEYLLQHYATRSLYDELLRAGMEIHEYRRSFLHAKVATIDDDWATVGSSNIDPFSLLLAREANVVVRDAGFTTELRAALDQAITQAEPVALRHVNGRSRLVRFYHAIAWGVLRLGVLMTGQASRY